MEKELEKTKRKTPLEHFQDIKELETADGPLVTVEDLLPYKCEKVEQALTELKAIKESKPSEAMECVDDINADLIGLPKHAEEYDNVFDDYLEDISIKISTIKQALLKAQDLEKVSAIFKTKPFNMIYFVDEIRPDIYKNSYADYKKWFVFMGGRINNLLTKEEFDTVKRWSEK